MTRLVTPSSATVKNYRLLQKIIQRGLGNRSILSSLPVGYLPWVSEVKQRVDYQGFDVPATGGVDMSEEVIQSTVKSLQCIYAVVIALSIGEALKQLVPDPLNSSESPRIHWDRLPSLLSLLILIVPFYQGMTRWFSDMYCTDRIQQTYGLGLLVDCAAFTVEAGLFFVLARSLGKNLWWQFNCTVVVLLGLDIVWGVFAWRYRTITISSWVIVNVCTVPFLTGVLYAWYKTTSWLAISLASLVILARTVADYWTGWQFYFPT